MATNEEPMAAAASVAASLEELRKSAVPRYRQPGVCRRKRIICTEVEWDRGLQQLKDSMGEYRVLGFDVECINRNNPRQCRHFQNQDVDRDPPNHFNGGYAPPPLADNRQYWQPHHRQQFQDHQNHRSHSPSLTNSSGGDGMDGTDDRRFSYPFRPPPKYDNMLPTPILPTPHSAKRRQEVAVLIQLATWSGLVVMLRLCFWRSIPESLREFLSDPHYLKLGVGIDQDAARLLEDWGLVVRGWIDLRHLCVDLCIQFSDYYQMRQMGLKKMAEGLFGSTTISTIMPMNIKKVRAIAWSDWNAIRLREEQIRYAAWDAQIAVDIFSLATQRLYSLSAPQRENRSYYEALYEKCAPFVDVPPSRHPRQTGDDYDDESDDFVSTSKDNSVAGDDDEIRDLCRIQAQRTGNRGFQCGHSPPPLSATATDSANVSVDAKLPPPPPPSSPAPIVQENGAGTSTAGSTETKVEKSVDRHLYCSVSISSLNKKSKLIFGFILLIGIIL